MKRRDWLLLAIADGLDPIRIQKAMFLFAMESSAPAQQKYEFEPYNWGPFSKPIYADLAALEADGLVERVEVPGASYYRYRRTADGERQTTALRAGAPGALVAALDDARAQVTRVGFDRLLRNVYDKYPTYATKSLFNQ